MRKGGKGEKQSRNMCVCVFIERVCKIMCALCNTVCIEGWWWVGWVDLATVRPISSSAVWNGCLATVTCKAHSSTETYISFIWPAHQHHIKSGSWIMSAALGQKDIVVTRESYKSKETPSTATLYLHTGRSTDLCTFAFRRCPLERTFDAYDSVGGACFQPL